MLNILMYVLLALVAIVLLAVIGYFLCGKERQAKIDRWLIERCHLISTSMFGSAMSYDAIGNIGIDELFWFSTYVAVSGILQVMRKVALKNIDEG